jgi:transposase
VPLSILLTAGQAGDNPQLLPVLDAISVNASGPGRPRKHPDVLIADKGYAHDSTRVALRRRGIPHVIPERSDQVARRAAKGSAGGRPPDFDPEQGTQRRRTLLRTTQAVPRPGHPVRQTRSDLPRLEAGALLVPAAACSVLAGRLVGALTDRFTGWQVLAGLSALAALGLLVVAVFNGPAAVVVGAALTVCGFAGAQAVLMGMAPELVTERDRDTAQGLLNFMVFLGGGIGPAAIAGLSGIVSVSAALTTLAALPLAGLVLSLTRRPGAERPLKPGETHGSRG